MKFLLKDVFKVGIYCTDLNEDCNALSSFVYSLKDNFSGRVLSNVGGWQSNDLDLSTPALNSLVFNITAHVKEYASILGLNETLHISNMWCNINGYKDFNRLHMHLDSMISGVFYIKTPKDCGNIRFVSAHNDVMESAWEKSRTIYNPYNSPEWEMPAGANVLYLFPSWLNHMVQPNLAQNDQRVSISFNCS